MSIQRNGLWCAAMLLGGCGMLPSQQVANSARASPPDPITVTQVAEAPPPASPVVASPDITPAWPATAARPAPVETARPVVHAVAPPPVEAPASRPAKPPVAKTRTVPTTQEPAAVTHRISGQVTLRVANGQSVLAGEQADTLVYFVPASGARRPKPGHYTVYTNHRDFSPAAMAVPQGSTVTFVNLDNVRHNVFSVTPDAAFNLGYQASGEKVAHAFTRPGVVLISCSVHRAMELDLLVVPSAYTAEVASDGSFSLSGVPAGAGTLYFWNPRARPVSQTVHVPTTEVIQQRIVLIKPRMATQMHAGGDL